MIAELRIYTIAPGRTDELLAQFYEVSLPLFQRHGITAHGPWLRELVKGEQLFYLLEFEDEQDQQRRWSAFRNDPQWRAVQQAGAGQPPLVAGIDAVALRRSQIGES